MTATDQNGKSTSSGPLSLAIKYVDITPPDAPVISGVFDATGTTPLGVVLNGAETSGSIVVKGTALVTKGEEEVLLTENRSTYIPLGVKHRLENPGKTDLELIEVQSGSYLGEDDIVRFEDTYGRG